MFKFVVKYGTVWMWASIASQFAFTEGYTDVELSNRLPMHLAFFLLLADRILIYRNQHNKSVLYMWSGCFLLSIESIQVLDSLGTSIIHAMYQSPIAEEMIDTLWQPHLSFIIIYSALFSMVTFFALLNYSTTRFKPENEPKFIRWLYSGLMGNKKDRCDVKEPLRHSSGVSEEMGDAEQEWFWHRKEHEV